MRVRIGRDHVVAQAWGPGAKEGLDTVASLVGERDDPTALVPRDSFVADLARRLPGLRLTSGAPLYETLLFSILGQKVTSFEARRSFGMLIRRFGEPAPGPLGLMLPPPPAKLARTPYWAFHALGIERRRAETIRAAAAAAHRFDSLVRAANCRAHCTARVTARHWPVDRGRGDQAVVRRPGRRQRGRLPPAITRLLGAGRRARRHRSANARIAPTVRRPKSQGRAADRASRNALRAPRTADGAAFDRRDVEDPTLMRRGLAPRGD